MALYIFTTCRTQQVKETKMWFYSMSLLCYLFLLCNQQKKLNVLVSLQGWFQISVKNSCVRLSSLLMDTDDLNSHMWTLHLDIYFYSVFLQYFDVFIEIKEFKRSGNGDNFCLSVCLSIRKYIECEMHFFFFFLRN